jgi:hypothetical protein
LENQREEHMLPGRVGTSGRCRKWRNDEGGPIWHKYSVHMYVNGKMICVEIIPGIG